MPLLLCIAAREVYTNRSFQEWIGKKVSNGKVIHYDAKHFDFYPGEFFEQTVKDQIQFTEQINARTQLNSYR